MMPRKYSRAREKFMQAVHKLAVGEGDVRDRLRKVFRVLNRLNEADLPPELVDDWHWIMKQLTRHGPETGPDGEIWRNAVDNTMSRIRNKTGRAIAERVFSADRILLHMSKKTAPEN